MNMPYRIGQSLACVLLFVRFEQLVVFVDTTGNNIKVELFCGLRLAIHEQGEALGSGITKPFFDREAIALRLRDLLPALVKEQLIVKTLRRSTAQHATDFSREPDRIDEIFAGHLVINAQ